MAAIAFDPLEYTDQLEASGVPREQAEVHAKAMTAMFLHNFDALVTLCRFHHRQLHSGNFDIQLGERRSVQLGESGEFHLDKGGEARVEKSPRRFKVWS